MRNLFHVMTEAGFLMTAVMVAFTASLAFASRVQAHEDKPHAIPAHWHMCDAPEKFLSNPKEFT